MNTKENIVYLDLQPRDNLELLQMKDIDVLPTSTILDKMLGEGLPKNALMAVLGGTGDGKSLFLLHTAIKMSQTYKILYFSFENDTVEDAERIRYCVRTYQKADMDNFSYINAIDEERNGKIWNSDSMYHTFDKMMAEGTFDYDMIFIDAIQTVVDTEEEEHIHSIGNKMMKTLKAIVYRTNAPIIFTWQAARSSYGKKLKEITCDDTSGSIGSMRYCTNVVYVKREDNYRKIKLLKARHSKDARIYEIFDLEGENTPFNVNAFQV